MIYGAVSLAALHEWNEEGKTVPELEKASRYPPHFLHLLWIHKAEYKYYRRGGKRRAASGRHHQCCWLEMMIWQKVKITPPSGIGASQDEPMNWHNSSTVDGWYYNYIPRGTTYLSSRYVYEIN